MNRRSFLAMLGASLLSATGAMAQTYADLIVSQLAEQGFENISVEITLLGRVRIRAEGEIGLREIILNPKTGEILRDLWFDADGNPVVPRLISQYTDTGSDTSDDSEDNSGSGSSSGSGSGSSGSGSGSDSSSGSDGDADKEDDKDEDEPEEDRDRREDRDDRDRIDD